MHGTSLREAHMGHRSRRWRWCPAIAADPTAVRNPVAKQFAVLAGDRSMLQDALRRFAPLAPPDRTVVIVPREHAGLAHAQLAQSLGVHVLSQPMNRGTGAGILWPLTYILARDQHATVVIAPSDHFVPCPAPFVDAVAEATALVGQVPVTLVGVRTELPDPDYGWIVPGRWLRPRVRVVARFVEKPAVSIALGLHAEGALCNTFVTIASGRVLAQLARARLPEQAKALARCSSAECATDAMLLDRVYAGLPASDFSRDVLEQAGGLAVIAVEAATISPASA